jgi:hypothetical protein
VPVATGGARKASVPVRSRHLRTVALRHLGGVCAVRHLIWVVDHFNFNTPPARLDGGFADAVEDA